MPDVDAKAGDGVSAENAEEAGQKDSSSSRNSNSIDIDQLQNKRFKAADLPLTAAQRQSIDGLLYRFKKGGDFDAVRKKIWADFAEGDALEKFKQLLLEKAESEIDREPSLLSRERGKAATLIEGAVDRSDLYKNIEDTLNKYTSSHLDSILEVLRTLRRRDVSEEQARAEEESGKKPDEEYKEIVEARRREREIAHLKELEIQKQKEIEEAKRQAEEAEKKREAKRRQAEEERRIRDERDERRRAERDKLREDHMTLDELRDKERYDRRRRDDKPYHRDSRDRPLGDRWEPSMDRNRSPNPPAPIDEKSLEDAALELLLKEGKELAERSRHRPEFNFEKADPLDASTSHASPSSRPKPGSLSKVPPDDPDSKRARYDRGREPRSYTINDRQPYAPRIRDERGRVDREHSRAEDRGRDRSSAGGNDGYRPSYRRDSHPRWESSRSRSPDRRYGRGSDWRDRDRDRDRDRERERERDKPGMDIYRPSASTAKVPERDRERRRRSRSGSIRKGSPARGGGDWRRYARREEDKTPRRVGDEDLRRRGNAEENPSVKESDVKSSTAAASRRKSDAGRSPFPITREKDKEREREREKATTEDKITSRNEQDRQRERERERERDRDRDRDFARIAHTRGQSRERARDVRDRDHHRSIGDRDRDRTRDRGRSPLRSQLPRDRDRDREHDRDGSDHYRPARGYSPSRSPPPLPRPHDHRGHRRRRSRTPSRSRSPSRRRRSRSPRPRRAVDGDRYIPGAGIRGRSRSRSPVRRRRSVDRERERERERDNRRERDRDRRDRDRNDWDRDRTRHPA